MASNAFHLANGKPKTVIVTGGAGGIGAQTIREFHSQGCNVVIADLPFAESSAQSLIQSLSEPTRALYHLTDITNWESMQKLFKATKKKFGQVDIVVANAGMMESKDFFDFEEDESGELKESPFVSKVIDVNLKGTMNTLRLAMHSMSKNSPSSDGSRGSIVLIASTSGYFGGTGVVSYISSKHGVVGLMRSSQRRAKDFNVRVNVVAPFFTPTYITGQYSEEWKRRGLPANTVEDVADAVAKTATNAELKGASVMVAGKQVREIEAKRTALTRQWLGDEIAQVMSDGGKFFDDMGGYPMPKPRT